jgi:hypothetical protein
LRRVQGGGWGKAPRHRASKTTLTRNCVESSPLVAEKAGLVEVEKTKEQGKCNRGRRQIRQTDIILDPLVRSP